MKNSQKGFVIPLIIAIMAVLAIGGGVYVYNNKKSEAPAILDTQTQTTNQIQQTNTQTPPVNMLVDDNLTVDHPSEYSCNWRPEKTDYGPCAVTWGAYFDDEKCVGIGGCGPVPKVPFSSVENCKKVCENKIDRTANWKTYINPIGKYYIKYPTNWYLNTSIPSVTIANYDWSVGDGNDAPVSSENIVISITMYPNFSVSETVASWVNGLGLSNKRDILVDGIKAIRGRVIYTGQEESGYYKKGELSGDYVLVVYNGTGYLITYSPYDSKFISTFDQIISTFKFTK